MDVSQLKISPETLRFKPIPHAKKVKFRHENIKALIRSKPAGTYISNVDFAKACAFTAASAGSMIDTMLRHDEIRRTVLPRTTSRYCYTVTEDIKVTKPAKVEKAIDNFKQEFTPPVKEVVVNERPPVQQEPTTTTSVDSTLRDRAMQFAWSQNSDSLREFIRWIS